MNYLPLILAAAIDPGSLPNVYKSGNQDPIVTILNIAFAIAGALALLMIVISGLRYVLSAGDPEKTKKAKEGLIYALVGLVIAITAEAIVAFAVSYFQGASSL